MEKICFYTKLVKLVETEIGFLSYSADYYLCVCLKIVYSKIELFIITVMYHHCPLKLAIQGYSLFLMFKISNHKNNMKIHDRPH